MPIPYCTVAAPLTMLKALCYGLLVRQPFRSTMTSSASTTRRFLSSVDPAVLAQDWSKQLLSVEDDSSNNDLRAIVQATTQTLPLLEDASSVPFVCRYRTEVIHPLTTRQVFLLHALKEKHASLATLRTKLLECIDSRDVALQQRIQTSTSKSELEDLYAPFKPPSKGSILERIQKEHPKLVEIVDNLWNNPGTTLPPAKSLQPQSALVHLLGTKIAGHAQIVDLVMEELVKHCLVKTTSCSEDDTTANSKYRNYHDFSCLLVRCKDFQVLAIRRGVQQKAIKMAFDVDGEKMKRTIQWKVRQLHPWMSRWNGQVMEDAIQDAWSRLLRRRGTTRLWMIKCKEAEERAMQVFQDNLRDALLAPPLPRPLHVLALDPGFKAGNKCAILDPNGNVVRLETISYLGSQRENGMKRLGELLQNVKRMMNNDEQVVVALGNGSGSQEGRALLEEVSNQVGIPIDIHLVNEAGASVWSVTQAAKDEFPNEPPSAIAAVSIGRRLQNPLHDLIKVPPKSLGLGMYQHDLSEKELDEKLHLTSVDAVATVGVDINTCSTEILQKVPGLTKLASKILKARPLLKRRDLINVPGLGPKTFENCAAFCRVEHGTEALDATLVHPESYDIARWLLKHFNWNLSHVPSNVPPREEWSTHWKSLLVEASEKFGVSQERILSVIENLVDSMTGLDPRLRNVVNGTKPVASSAGSLNGCVLLPPELASNATALQEACPKRGIVGTVRNIADFGAFVDFGGAHGDGLLHTSCLGPISLDSLLIGQQIGVDILNVDNDRVSLGLSGLGLIAAAKRPPSTISAGRAKGGANSQRRKYSTFDKQRSGSRKHSDSSAKRRKTAR